MENREWTVRTRGVVYTIYQTIYVCSPALPCSSLCLTLVLGTAITFALRLWHGCSGIALRAQPQSRSKLRVRVLAATASSRNSSLSNGSAQRWLLNVINLASLRFHVSSLSQRNCFRSCQLQFVASWQLPAAAAFTPRGVFSACRLGHCLGLKLVLTLC